MDKATPSCVYNKEVLPLESLGNNRYKLIIPENARPGDKLILNDGEGSSKPIIVQEALYAGRTIIIDFDHKQKSNPTRRNTNEERWRVSMEWNTRMTKKLGSLLHGTINKYSCGTCTTTRNG